MSETPHLTTFHVSALQDRRVAFVGKLGSMNRREARELVREHGGVMVDRVDPTVDLIVIGADELPISDADELLEDWTVDAAAKGQLEIINEAQLWQNLNLEDHVDHDWDIQHLYTPAMLAGLLDLPLSTIRRWHRRGLIRPARQVNKLAYFDFQEVASARRIARFIADGVSPAGVEKKLARLAELYPEMQRPLSQLSVLVEGQDVLLRHGEGLVEPGGQMRINFDVADEEDSNVNAEDSQDHVISMIGTQSRTSEPDQFTTPDEFIIIATELEDDGEIDGAIETYRAMSLAYGPSADVSFRLAELLYQQHDLPGARERYYSAIELDDSFVEARASLGCVLVELGQFELARSVFAGALVHHADYPDVHFHLARLLDEMGQSVDAEIHWRRFLELAPKSPWAEEARGRLRTK